MGLDMHLIAKEKGFNRIQLAKPNCLRKQKRESENIGRRKQTTQKQQGLAGGFWDKFQTSGECATNTIISTYYKRNIEWKRLKKKNVSNQ